MVKMVQDISTEVEAETPRTLPAVDVKILDRRGEVHPHKFKKIYERLLEIPFQEEIEIKILFEIDEAVKKSLKLGDSDVVPSLAVIKQVAKELKNRDVRMMEPPEDLVDEKLRAVIQEYDSVEQLTGHQIKELLKKKEDYVLPYRNKHRVSIHDSRKIDEYVHRDSGSFFPGPGSDI